MKKALMYGAGNIGRGFIGKKFSDSGYEVCFVDVDMDIIDALNSKQCYPVKIVSNDASHIETVHHVYGVDGKDLNAVANAICEAEIMAIAVGVHAVKHIIQPLTQGLRLRKSRRLPPLNIIICENMADADQYLKNLILKEIGEENHEWLSQNIGFVKASIGRMVPVVTAETKAEDPLMVWVEPYDELQIDSQAIRGASPELINTISFTPFDFFIKRKLFIHNMGHAAAAYLGWQKGLRYIYECVADPAIFKTVRSAMMESAQALANEFDPNGIQLGALEEHVDDLLMRFGNRHLGDTIERVANDPLRKLAGKDRLVGAALYCLEQNINPDHIVAGISAGLKYNNPRDKASMAVQKQMAESGLESTICKICGVKKGHPLVCQILEKFYT